MLYFVATPIGNLGDITYRAVETLKNCDYILCEDTRYSKRLLDAYEIKTPCRSYHKFNEQKCLDRILDDLREDKKIALVSDAGTPGICDPGWRLASACVKEKLPFTVIPGASAGLTALALSGLPTDRFQFLGFLPKSQSEILEVIEEMFRYPGISIIYEAPHRLLKTLHLFAKIDGKREIAIARELTKLHEECLRDTVDNLIVHLESAPLKGEFVLLVEGKREETTWPDIQEHVASLQRELGLSLSDAIKKAADLRGVSKRQIYQIVHKLAVESTDC